MSKKERKPVAIGEVTLHELRHTFATRLLEQGESMKTIQELLGHARENITANIYTHVSLELMKNAVSKLDSQHDADTICTKFAPKSKN